MVEYVIEPDGTYSMKTIDVKGKSCVSEISKRVAMVGGVVVDEHKTSDYYKDGPKATISGGHH